MKLAKRKIKGGGLLPKIFAGGLVVLPLVFWPWSFPAYEIPRVWFLQRWVELLAIVAIVSGQPVKQRKINKGLLVGILVWVIVAVVASWQGVDLPKSMEGNFYRGDGLFTLFHLVGLWFFLVLFWEKSWRKMTARAIVWGIMVTSAWAVIRGFRLLVLKDVSMPNWQGAIDVTFGQPNFLAGYLLVSLPFLVYVLSQARGKRKIFWSLGLMVVVTAIVLARSWAGIVGIGGFAAGWAILKWGKKAWKVVLSVVVLIIVGGWFYVENYTSLGFVHEKRGRIFARVWAGVKQRPVLGWGLANVDKAYEAGAEPTYFYYDVYVDKAHATLLEVLATTGAVGLAAYVAILGVAGVSLVRKFLHTVGEEKKWWGALLLVFLLFLAHSQTNVISVGEEALFWVVLGAVGSS